MALKRKKILWFSIGIPAGFLLIVFLTERIVRYKAQSLPENNPSVCSSPGFAPGKPLIAAIGDSITHGRVSSNYVDLLQTRNPSLYFVNAGINSELAWNARQRAAEVMRCHPVAVTILIGTNDVNARLSPANEARYMKNQKLPRRPDPLFYQDNLASLIDIVRRGTHRVAVMTLTPIGEDAGSTANQMVIQYNQIIQDTAKTRQVEVLPLFETVIDRLRDKPVNSLCGGGVYPMEIAVGQHFLLRKSWNDVGHGMGFHFLTDCLHLNDDGAAVVAELVQAFLDKSVSEKPENAKVR